MSRSAGQDAGGSRRASAFTRLTVTVMVVALSVTAVIGIITLVTGSLGEIQSKVMLTTLIIGIYALSILCDLVAVASRFWLVGVAGITAATGAVVTGVLLVWVDLDGWGAEVWKAFLVFIVVAASLAQTSLLLQLAGGPFAVVRELLLVTLGLIVVLATLLCAIILGSGDGLRDDVVRFVGAVAILDALGSIVVPLLATVSRRRSTDSTTPAILDGRTALDHTVVVPHRVADLITQEAARTGRTTAEVVAAVIEEHYRGSEPTATTADSEPDSSVRVSR